MANYAILRMEKRKLAAVGRIGKHNERLKKEYKSNPDIDPGRTNLNYHIIEPRDVYRKAVLDRIEEVGAKRRKDSVVMQDCFIGVTPEWIRAKPSEEKTGFSPWTVVTALRGCVWQDGQGMTFCPLCEIRTGKEAPEGALLCIQEEKISSKKESVNTTRHLHSTMI